MTMAVLCDSSYKTEYDMTKHLYQSTATHYLRPKVNPNPQEKLYCDINDDVHSFRTCGCCCFVLCAAKASFTSTVARECLSSCLRTMKYLLPFRFHQTRFFPRNLGAGRTSLQGSKRFSSFFGIDIPL